jgi:hypothetical protein
LAANQTIECSEGERGSHNEGGSCGGYAKKEGEEMTASYFYRVLCNGTIRIFAVEPFVWHDKEK